MELIIDPACSVAIEMEPEERDVMQRPPRNPRARLFTRILVVRSLLQGIGALAAAALVFGVSMRSGLIETDVRMLTFTTLIVTNLLLIVTNRSLTRPTLADWWTPNPALRWLGAGCTRHPRGDPLRAAHPRSVPDVAAARRGCAGHRGGQRRRLVMDGNDEASLRDE